MLPPPFACRALTPEEFYFACRDGNLNLILLAISGGFDVRSVFGPNRENGMMVAAFFGQTEVVRMFTENWRMMPVGFDFNAVNTLGETALMMAARRGDSLMVSLFLRIPHIDVNLENADGHRAVHLCAMSGKHHIITQFNLMRNILCIDLTAPDSHGMTALHHACEQKDADMLQAILNTNLFDVNQPCPLTGMTPLTLAVRACEPKILYILLSHPKINVSLVTSAPSESTYLAPNTAVVENTKVMKQVIQPPNSSRRASLRKTKPYQRMLCHQLPQLAQNQEDMKETGLSALTNAARVVEQPEITPLSVAIYHTRITSLRHLLMHPDLKINHKSCMDLIDRLYLQTYNKKRRSDLNYIHVMLRDFYFKPEKTMLKIQKESPSPFYITKISSGCH